MFRTARHAFTLIELLVVIAIIAILAAILFPVFAQAREKARQAVCISNLKQNGLAIMQYEQDYDETLPQAELLDTGGGGWIQFNLYATPANLYRADNTTCELCTVEWSNAIQPYMKNYNVFDCPSTTSTFDYQITTQTPVRTPARMAYSFNGDLQMYPEAGILAPAAVILLWNGFEKNAWLGWTMTNPELNCPDPNSPCIYQPTANANGNCPAANGGTDVIVVYTGQPNYNIWVHGQGDNFIFADGHVKWSPLHGDYRVDPWGGPGNTEDSNGNISDGNSYSYAWDGCHAYLFRPDYQP